MKTSRPSLEDEQPAKRYRSDGSIDHVGLVCKSRDCYQEALQECRHGCSFGASPLRSSWLQVEWFGVGEEPMIEGSVQDLKDEIKLVRSQLLQVKRRLGVAAEQASAVTNAYCGFADHTNAQREFAEARRACNPYEVLGERKHGGLNSLFMNRSAIKLANMDALLGFALTNHMGEGPFVFADLCGAPGGFSEYTLRRCEVTGVPVCRGYGMSLVKANENGMGTAWKLKELAYTHNGASVKYRICHGEDGSGDVFRWDNVESLWKMILEDGPSLPAGMDIDARKASLVLADGGVDVQRDAEDQEGVTQKLVVCEVAAALALLRPGGTLVVKMFGFQTPVIRAVMASLRQGFQGLAILKPISSRPASAERYVVCTGFRGLPVGWNGPQWRDRMFLGDGTVRSNGGIAHEDPALLNAYLDHYDRDMLTLNLKACFAILSHMETKAMQSNNEVWDDPPSFFVDLDRYRRTWQLDSL